jgi:hypothetical protein
MSHDDAPANIRGRIPHYPSLTAKIQAPPGAEQGLADVERFFCKLEARTDPALVALLAQLEEIINGDVFNISKLRLVIACHGGHLLGWSKKTHNVRRSQFR